MKMKKLGLVLKMDHEESGEDMLVCKALGGVKFRLEERNGMLMLKTARRDGKTIQNIRGDDDGSAL